MRRSTPAGGKVPFAAPRYIPYTYVDTTIDQSLNITGLNLLQPVPPGMMPFSGIVPVRVANRPVIGQQPAVRTPKPFLGIIPWQAIFKPQG